MGEKFKQNGTLEIPGGLNLSAINFPRFPKNVVVNVELNNYLRDQLEQMKKENESFQQELLKKETQLHQSQIKIQDLTEKCSEYEANCTGDFTSASQVASSKIVELSKKLREKNSEIEVYKTKCTKLEKCITEFEARTEIPQKNEKQENCTSEPDEIKKIQDKLAYTTNKWIEEKNLTLQLKNDLRRANKWLQQEVGDKFETLLALNNSNTSWRGRAQIICDLQQKNQELKEKLKTYHSGEGSPVKDDNQKKYIKKIEDLNQQNSDLKNNWNELKRKFDVLKRRCKVLENECTQVKAKLSRLTEVHEADQEIVTKLTSQVSQYNDLRDQDLKQKDQIIRKLEQENEALKVELVKEKCVSENKSRELLEKNDDIQLLNKRLRSSRPPSAYVRKNDNNTEGNTINKLEVERLRLLELTEIQNTRLEEERNAHFKTQNFLRVEKQKCAKLEANVARLQLEQTSSRSSYGSKYNTPKQTDDDLKNKLEIAEENIKALKTRLEIESLERKRDLKAFGKILKNYNSYT